jgi:hypothetical protein
MTLRLSKALRNFQLQHGSIKNALQNGIIEVYSGAQPTNADDAVSGTLLCTFTKNGSAYTPETLATGNVTLTGGASGSINTVTVNGINIIPQGAVVFNTSLNQTATDLAAAINAGLSSPEYRASAVGAVVTIFALPGTGTGPNGFVVATTLTTITTTTGNMAGGVAPANGLTMGSAAAGVIAKTASETWQGTAVATGTAGWFRFKGSVLDAGAADALEAFIRLDGSIATSGGNLNMSNTSIVTGAVQSLSTFQLTAPAQ